LEYGEYRKEPHLLKESAQPRSLPSRSIEDQ
jgi:hypothetical protein